MALNVARPTDQFPVAELRAAARAAGEAVDDIDYLQSAVRQLSELVGSHMCSLLLLRDGRLSHGGSVGLPDAFMDAIDGIGHRPPRGHVWRGRLPRPPDGDHGHPRGPEMGAVPGARRRRRGCGRAGRCRCASRAGPCWAPSRPTTTVQGSPTPASWSWPRRTRRWWRSGLDRIGREARLSESYEAVVVALSSALDVRDEYTGEHSTETARMALEVGRRMGLDKAGLQRLEQAAMLHDIGKLGIPTEILHAPRALTAEERTVMEQHPVIGERILKGIPYLEEVARAVRHEHERWDGTGYPDGLAGEAIPLASRIVFACDAWHAMTSDRPYRKALPDEVAREELAANAGTQFDPRAVEAVLAVVGRRSGEPAPPIGGQVDAESEENHRIQQLASVAEQTGADDLFVFRLTSAGRYSHVDGTGRGAGWAGNVELDAEHEPAFAEAVSGGRPVCLSHDETGPRVRPLLRQDGGAGPARLGSRGGAGQRGRRSGRRVRATTWSRRPSVPSRPPSRCRPPSGWPTSSRSWRRCAR